MQAGFMNRVDEGWKLEYEKRGESAGFVSNGATPAATPTRLAVYPVPVPVLYQACQGRDPLAPLYAFDKEN